ncbi:MAG: hypothetical protein JST38_10865 [Bacteroidetes bacterium]|nr:hypothetical protein [Bacteroidota bacterium]
MPIVYDKKQSAAIAAQVQLLLELHRELETANGQQAQQLAGRIAHVEGKVDGLVCGLYGLNEGEIGVLG